MYRTKEGEISRIGVNYNYTFSPFSLSVWYFSRHKEDSSRIAYWYFRFRTCCYPWFNFDYFKGKVTK